jgi:hypothetical protein
MIVAPMFASDSSTTRLLSPASPPARPCIARQALMRKHPLMQAHAADAEGIVDALIGAGDKAVKGHRYLEKRSLDMASSPELCVFPPRSRQQQRSGNTIPSGRF